MYRVGQIWRGKGPLEIVQLISRLPNGWVIEVFDYVTHARMDGDLVFIEETGERVNIRTIIVQGEDPLAPFKKQFRKIA